MCKLEVDRAQARNGMVVVMAAAAAAQKVFF
jgi:hypothetical protein